ncbi:MAG TPA: hypothetical protein VIT92_13645 [Burkholderiaceae bacterium]
MFTFSTTAFQRLVRASAIYDVLATALFATPWTFVLAHGHISAVNGALGGQALPAFSPFHVLFACLLGSVVLVWSALRIRYPAVLFGRMDAIARVLFSTWMLWAYTQTGAAVLWLFIVPEIAWGIVQLLPVARPVSEDRYAIRIYD